MCSSLFLPPTTLPAPSPPLPGVSVPASTSSGDNSTLTTSKFSWLQLGSYVVKSLNDGFRKGELSTTQKEGVIICIPKGYKSKDLIKNWKPISLLNVVYIIGSACIAKRLKSVLPSLINEDQIGFMANRYTGDNIRLLYDLLVTCTHSL